MDIEALYQEIREMRKQLEMWHLLVGMVITIISSAAFAWNFAVANGRDKERLELTQRQHGERITKLETNAELDRRENRDQYSRISQSLFDIQLMLKDKQDRK